ncbi:hypothetical protein ACFW04_009268 [Cataglyphis niger]
MDVERIAMFAGVGFAIVVGLFVLWGPSPKPRKKGQVIGINNLGYTCFLNSLLQALAACPTFILWLQRQQEKNRNFADTLLSVLKKINGFADDMYGDVTPIEIISSVGSLWNFGPGHQDAHELFHVVLSALDAEIQPANRSSVRYDKLETLSLPLPPLTSFMPQHHTLEWLLSRFVDSEMVRDVQCDGCSLRCAAVKTLTLGKLPKCLCLHIPRTTWSSSGVLIKRDDQITFPELLVLDPYTYTETKKRSVQGDAVKFLDSGFTTIQGKHKYRLCAVIEHRGPVDSGHFVCFRRGNKTDQWLYTSDIIVESVSLTQVLLASPYLLFYERISSVYPS